MGRQRDQHAGRNLTRSPSFDRFPVWSPDGRMVAFVSRRDGNQEIYVMNADGSRQRRLTRTPWNDTKSCLVARAEEVVARGSVRRGAPMKVASRAAVM